MEFINPIELLNLQEVPVQEIDSSTIKKAKRKVLAEIDFSEIGFITYKGIQINKSNLDWASNELEENDKIEFYHFIANNKHLNNFLTAGDERLFQSFRLESIYKLPEFIKLISTHFAEKYDKALLIAFKENNENSFRKIISVEPLVTDEDKDKAYTSITNKIKERIKEIDILTAKIKNEEENYDAKYVDKVYDLVNSKFNVELINILPSYFQNLINQIALCIRNLSVSIFNSLGDSQLALYLMSYALFFDIDNLTRKKLTDDYDQINKINARHIEEEKHAPILEKYVKILIEIQKKIKETENKEIPAISLQIWVKNNISVSTLNSIESSIGKIRDHIAIGLRALSITIWNSLGDIDIALYVINITLTINTDQETHKSIDEVKNQLSEIKRKIDLKNILKVQTPSGVNNQGTNKSLPTKNSSTVDSGCLQFYILMFIMGFIFFVALLEDCSSKNLSSDTTIENNTNENYTSSNDPIVDSPINNNNNPESIIIESQYRGNQLANGSSPLNECFGRGIYDGNAILTVKNGGNSDAIVCLYSVDYNKTIRNEYVKINTDFTMTNIPQGYYKIRVLYGNDWNPELVNNCGTKGNFERDIYFSEFDRTEYFEDSSQGYTIATITLYTVSGGNTTSSSINQSTFFNN
jgi:hypothetical protein